MRLGREVGASVILSSCIAILSSAIGVFGIDAVGSRSVHTTSDGRAVPRVLLHCCATMHGAVSSVAEYSELSSRAGTPYPVPLAMAIPDGPGAVCLGILGFVCVSVVKNRRVWIGLCLYLLSCNRICMARSSRGGSIRSDGTDPDRAQAGKPPCALDADSVCWTHGSTAPVIMQEPIFSAFQGLHLSAYELHEHHASLGLAPQESMMFGGARETRPKDVGRLVPLGSSSVGCVELARPPPA